MLGGEAADVNYEFFAKLIYAHTDSYPMGRMGNYSRTRLPDAVLRELYRFVKDDLRLLVPLAATVDSGVASGANRRYTLRVKNNGAAGKGLNAEDITIALKLTGAQLVDATGPGTQKKADGGVSWQVSRLTPQQELTYSITLSGATAPPLQLFSGSRVDYLKPTMRDGAPNLKLPDPRWLGSRNDWVPVGMAPPAPAPAQTAEVR